jgi:S-adenosylmethionine synthetase
MGRQVIVEELQVLPVSRQRIEIVERKGLGHPDTIVDQVVNEIAVELAKEYIARAGGILHHNIDKALLIAGETDVRFGGGMLKRPMKLVIGDRATYQVEGLDIPVDEIAVRAAKRWISENLHYVDPEDHLVYQVELYQGSAALQDIFRRPGELLGANDTSAAVGYAPLTPTERLVLETERFLNSKGFKSEFPDTGEDVKVMGLRWDSRLDLTVAMPFVDRFIESETQYFRRKSEVLEAIREFLRDRGDFEEIRINFNTLDQPGRGIDGTYLTVLGTSADGADSGQVGRGNRVNGVIALNRPSGSEAAAGKNPVSHVGKIYNILSFRIAEEIHREVSGLNEVYVWLLSQIGQQVDMPKMASVQLVAENPGLAKEVSEQVVAVVERELDNLGSFIQDLIKGKYPVC